MDYPRVARLFAISVFVLFIASSVTLTQDLESPQSRDSDIFPKKLVRGDRLEGGSSVAACNYYSGKDGVAEQLRLPKVAIFDDLNGLLTYFGYVDLTADVLVAVPWDTLLSREKTFDNLRIRMQDAPTPWSPVNELKLDSNIPWDILAVHYFAPKTSDVSGQSDELSWRKAIRLRALPGSEATKNGVDRLFILTVSYISRNNLGTTSPYTVPPKNIQAIVCRARDESGGPRKRDPLYWLAFDPTHGYKTEFFSETTWDAGTSKLTGGIKRYHVADSCVTCHGGGREKGLLHYFDTDYSQDRLKPSEDFEAIGNSRWHPLHDGSKDDPVKLSLSMNAFRAINAEILDQNGDAPSLQRNGVENWLRLHGKPSAPMVDRYFPPQERTWQAADRNDWKGAEDMRLVNLLATYCYRCHGTLEYNIFDKSQVVDKVRNGDLLDRIESTDDDYRMPQDRPQIPEADRQSLLQLLNDLK